MLQFIKQIYGIHYKKHLGKNPEKSFLMLPTVKCLGHENGFIKNPPMQSKIAAGHNFPPSTKIERMGFLVQWIATLNKTINFK